MHAGTLTLSSSTVTLVKFGSNCEIDDLERENEIPLYVEGDAKESTDVFMFNAILLRYLLKKVNFRHNRIH